MMDRWDARSHFAIQFARALECEQVVVFSHSDDKKVRIYLLDCYIFIF